MNVKTSSFPVRRSALQFEERARDKGFEMIIGLDESGRGPLAGPVVASAVALREYTFQNKIGDSKILTAQEREKAFPEIWEKAYVGIGMMSEAVIDSVNILEATFLAMNNAVRRLVGQLPPLALPKICLLVDGDRFKTDLPYPFQTIVGGDNRSLSISCASIIAKVTRDRILKIYHRVFPLYGFDQHKGYPTPEHISALRQHGLSLIHRKTFHWE